MVQRGRQRDGDKERFWRDVVRRWQRSGQSIRAFCREQRLAEQAFHSWRRTLTQRDRQDKPTVVPPQPEPKPLFVPLRVIPSAPSVHRSALEVVAASGRVIRVLPGFDAATLQHLLAALEETPSC
jgi:hypothetical protein